MSDKEIDPFSLTKERFLLAHINVRSEKHGKEREPAFDMNFEASLHNSVLTKLHPELRALLYFADATKDFVDSEHMPHLRFPLISAVPYGLEVPRTMLTIHAGDEGDDLVLIDGKTKKFVIQPIDGGSVKIKFQVQFSKPDEKQVPKLMNLLQKDVTISLASQAAEEVLDNFEQAELLSQEPMSEARQAAEDLFSKPTGGAPLELEGDTAGQTENEAVAEVAAESSEAASNVAELPTTGRRRKVVNGAE